MKRILSSGSTIEEAVRRVVEKCGLEEGEYEYKVLEKGFKGIFGLFSKEAQVEVVINRKYYERKLKEFIENILRLSSIEGKVSTRSNPKTFFATIDTKDVGKLIGKHGKTLAALQHICTIYLNRMSDTKLNVVLDAGDYREKRKKQLQAIAREAIRKVLETKGKVELDPMFPFERRIIHEIVKKSRGVTSYSVGMEPYRRVVIEYVGREAKTRR